jgi:sugar-phosphatase
VRDGGAVTPHAQRLIAVDAVVFDCDGVLVDSLGSVDRSWRRWAVELGLDPEAVLAVIHGQPTRDSVPTLVPAAEVEAAIRLIDDHELEDADSVTPLPGTTELLAAIPPGRWAVVTSASRALFTARFAAAGLSAPAIVVTSDDVTRGKPHPEGYARAIERLGVAPERAAVFEDSSGGIAAAIASGAGTVIRVGTGEPGPGQTAVVADLRSVGWRDGLVLHPDGASS